MKRGLVLAKGALENPRGEQRGGNPHGEATVHGTRKRCSSGFTPFPGLFQDEIIACMAGIVAASFLKGAQASYAAARTLTVHRLFKLDEEATGRTLISAPCAPPSINAEMSL